MSQFYLLVVLLVASVSASDIVVSKLNSVVDQSEARGVITPDPTCRPMEGVFQQLEITNCNKFPCDILHTTQIVIKFTVTTVRQSPANVRLTYTPTTGTAPAPVVVPLDETLRPGQWTVTLKNLQLLTAITDRTYDVKIEVVPTLAPIATEVCVQGRVNWKVKASQNGSSVTSGSILGVVTLALVTIWKMM